ncbi:hypothetical protein BDC45DRAFT_80354 [Circinella umbellata]|nr:hypothetical protein BDC45DRAFT_80354 [Circinella umbellata]
MGQVCYFLMVLRILICRILSCTTLFPFYLKIYLCQILSQKASGPMAHLEKGKTTITYAPFKPDYVIFITKRSNRLDLTCAEAKSRINNHVFPKSDLVKPGQEMRWMVNKACYARGWKTCCWRDPHFWIPNRNI